MVEDKPLEYDPDGREYYRAEAALVVFFGPDDPKTRAALAVDRQMWETAGELEQKARQIFLDRDAHEELLPILDLLKWLDYKLDMVLFYQRRGDRERYFPHQGMTKDISGSGLNLQSEQLLSPGKTYLLSVSLPDAPSRPVVCVAAVVRGRGGAHQEELVTALNFTEISDVDRERVIRFTFQQQRRQLATRSREASE